MASPVIAEAWAKTRGSMFNDTQSRMTQDDMEKMSKVIERNVTRLGAMSTTCASDDDFDLLSKPLQEFQKTYIMLLGTLTAMGGGKAAGRSLRHEILAYGEEVTKAFSEVERVHLSRNVDEMKKLSPKVGLVLEVVKKLTKVPRSDAVAVKKRLLVKIRQMRDVARELVDPEGKDGVDERSTAAVV